MIKTFEQCANEVMIKYTFKDQQDYTSIEWAVIGGHLNEILKLFTSGVIKLSRQQVEKQSLITKYGRFTEEEILKQLGL